MAWTSWELSGYHGVSAPLGENEEPDSEEQRESRALLHVLQVLVFTEGTAGTERDSEFLRGRENFWGEQGPSEEQGACALEGNLASITQNKGFLLWGAWSALAAWRNSLL